MNDAFRKQRKWPKRAAIALAYVSIFGATAATAFLVPKSPVARNIASVCSVNGTVAGMDIQEHMTRTAVNSPTSAISLTVSFFVPLTRIAVSSGLLSLTGF